MFMGFFVVVLAVFCNLVTDYTEDYYGTEENTKTISAEAEMARDREIRPSKRYSVSASQIKRIQEILTVSPYSYFFGDDGYCAVNIPSVIYLADTNDDGVLEFVTVSYEGKVTVYDLDSDSFESFKIERGLYFSDFDSKRVFENQVGIAQKYIKKYRNKTSGEMFFLDVRASSDKRENAEEIPYDSFGLVVHEIKGYVKGLKVGGMIDIDYACEQIINSPYFDTDSSVKDYKKVNGEIYGIDKYSLGLISKLEDFIDDRIYATVVDDFEHNGKKTAFAFTGGEAYYCDGNKVYHVDGGSELYTIRRVGDYIVTQGMGGSQLCSIFEVANGKAGAISISGKGMDFSESEGFDNEYILIDTNYEPMSAHTWKPYWFYKDANGNFHEYKGTLISQKELFSIPGSEKILTAMKKRDAEAYDYVKESEIFEIFSRGNGIININLRRKFYAFEDETAFMYYTDHLTARIAKDGTLSDPEWGDGHYSGGMIG